MPELVRGDAVEGGELTGGEQEVNAGADGSWTVKEQREGSFGQDQLRLVNLPEGAALDMWGKLQFFDPVGGGSHRRRSMFYRYARGVYIRQRIFDLGSIARSCGDGEIELEKAGILLIHMDVELVTQQLVIPAQRMVLVLCAQDHEVKKRLSFPGLGDEGHISCCRCR